MNAPTTSPAQSVEKVKIAVIVAKQEASMFLGTIYMSITVMGKTCKQIRVAFPISMRKAFKWRSLIPQ